MGMSRSIFGGLVDEGLVRFGSAICVLVSMENVINSGLMVFMLQSGVHLKQGLVHGSAVLVALGVVNFSEPFPHACARIVRPQAQALQ